MKNNLYFLFLFLSGFMVYGCADKIELDANYGIVPLPQNVQNINGKAFALNKNTQIVYAGSNDTLKQTAHFLSEFIKQNTGMDISISDEVIESNVIILQCNYTSDNGEAYLLNIDEDKIIINGASQAAVFYGVQTLRKSIPLGKKIDNVYFQPVVINDFPRFSYRGMHLDVGRHMFSVNDIKKYIDILALHNINYFHWHLTDDQGWRIEIKKHPELTEIGSKREQTVIGKNSGKYDGTPYGSFYTQSEIKEIVKYAQDRFITVIPEIDLPGHMLAALASYPQLGCTGGPYKVAQQWGIFDDVLCAGNEEIYPFLEDVFEEVIDLFPSTYIHLGGDECLKTKWEKCPKCQAKIRELGIKADSKHTAEEQLQSYVIQRIEKYINSKGRKTIGWDEILEGGIAPNATIMSWRGTEGGIYAATQHHDAIMTPSDYLYLDYFQDLNIRDELSGVGGYVPVRRVYDYEPVADELTDDEKKFIIGVQANVWTEYMKDFEKVQYMVLPRIAALSEIQWTMPEKKDYGWFMGRLVNLTKMYDRLGYKYAKHIFNVEGKLEYGNTQDRHIQFVLSTYDNAPVYYTLDGKMPDHNSILYTDPILINEKLNIKAIAIREGNKKSQVFERNLHINKATLKSVTVKNNIWGRYSYGGLPTLVDGQSGEDRYDDGRWIAFREDFVATVDLEKITDLSSVSIGSFIDIENWIFLPVEYSVEVSDDNIVFKRVFKESYSPFKDNSKIGAIQLLAKFPTIEARYVRITAKHLPRQSKQAEKLAGRSTALFIDEIMID